MIFAVYSPPRHKISADEYSSFFNILSARLISCGDFKAKHTKWGSRLKTPRGRDLQKAIHNNNCCAGKPTYWPTNS